MNKIIKKIVSSIMIGTLLVYTMPVFAYTNEETIYSKLDASGSVYKNIASIFYNNSIYSYFFVIKIYIFYNVFHITNFFLNSSYQIEVFLY